MNLGPTDWSVLTGFVIFAIYVAAKEDSRMIDALVSWWRTHAWISPSRVETPRQSGDLRDNRTDDLLARYELIESRRHELARQKRDREFFAENERERLQKKMNQFLTARRVESARPEHSFNGMSRLFGSAGARS